MINKVFFSININIRSQVNNKHFSSLECFLNSLDVLPQVIGINETWEKPTSFGSYKNLAEYNYISNYRTMNTGGGVGMYIKRGMKYKKNSELSIMKEGIFVSILIDLHFKNKVVSCGTIYRDPKQDKQPVSEFLITLRLLLETLSNTKKTCHVVGDINVNINTQNQGLTDAFTEVMFESSFYSLINKPTGISDSNATCIDHIWKNCLNCPINSAIITHMLADHMPVMQCSHLGKPEEQLQHSRVFNQNKLELFNEHLNTVDITSILTQFDPNKAVNLFSEMYMSAFDQHFVLKRKNRKRSNQNWFDNELKKLLRKKDLFKRYISDKTIET